MTELELKQKIFKAYQLKKLEDEDFEAYKQHNRREGYPEDAGAISYLPIVPYSELTKSLQQQVEDLNRQQIREIIRSKEMGLQRELTDDEITEIIHAAQYMVCDIDTDLESISSAEDIGQLCILISGFSMNVAFRRVIKNESDSQEETGKERKSYVSSFYKNQIIPSDLDLRFALTPKQNKSAFIAIWDREFIANLKFDAENGRLIYDTSEQKKMTMEFAKRTKNGLKRIQQIDFPLLRQLFTACYNSLVSYDKYTMTVNLVDLCDSMGVHLSHGEKANPLFDKLDAFRDCIGIINGMPSIVFQFLTSENNGRELVFASPYFCKIMQMMSEKNKRISPKGKEYTIPHVNKLMKSTIVKERNKVAAEIVFFLTTSLLERGRKKTDEKIYGSDKKYANPDAFTKYVTIGQLLNSIPILQMKVDAQQSNYNKNHVLQRAFTPLLAMIQKQTFAFEYFTDLQIVIPEVVTIKDIDKQIVMTYTGINGDFRFGNAE